LKIFHTTTNEWVELSELFSERCFTDKRYTPEELQQAGCSPSVKQMLMRCNVLLMMQNMMLLTGLGLFWGRNQLQKVMLT